MNQVSLRIAAVGLCISAAHGLSSASAQEPFYKGKRLSLMVNFAPGGGVDIEGRLFARHVAKHIDGYPNVIIQNMEGAGGLNAINYLGQVAPKDGAAIGYFGGTPWQYVVEPDRFRVDHRLFEFVAFQPITSVYYVRTDVPPGMKAAADIIKANGLIAGGQSPYNQRVLTMRLALDMLEVRFKFISRYSSASRARLALQRNEINFFSETAPGYRSAVEPGLVKAGMAIPTHYDPGWNGEMLTASNQVKGLSIQPFHELYEFIKGTKPTGRLWDAYVACISLTSRISRLVLMPPGAPPRAVEALRIAVQKLSNDAAFAEEALKTVGYVPEYEAGPDTTRQARQIMDVSPETRAFFLDYIKSANR